MPSSVIIAGARTPVGRLLGGLAPLSAAELGGIAVRSALEKAGVNGESLNHRRILRLLPVVGDDRDDFFGDEAASLGPAVALLGGKVCVNPHGV